MAKISGLIDAGKIPTANQTIVDRMPRFANSLITETEQHGSSEIVLDQIDVSPFQPRINFALAELQALADSISIGALIEPITVRLKTDLRYELIAGERRLRAHQLLGYRTIPAVIKTLEDKEAALLALASNTVREDLSDFELGLSFKKLLDNNYVKNVAELARYIGKSRQQIDRCLDFIKLPDIILKKLAAKPNLFGASCAEILVSFCDKGFEDNVIAAVEMLEAGSTEQKAIFWLRNQCNTAKTKRSKQALGLFANKQRLGEAYIERNKVIIHCNAEVKPAQLLALLNETFQEIPENDINNN